MDIIIYVCDKQTQQPKYRCKQCSKTW